MVTRYKRIFDLGRSTSLLLALSMLGTLAAPACEAQVAPATQPPAATAAPAAAMPEWQKAAGGKMQFDVASVKQNKTNDRPKMNVPLGPGDVYTPTGGSFSVSNVPLLAYIFFAYKLTANQWPAMQKQLPEWVLNDKFDIEAKSDNQNATKDQMRLMVQALLADRFKLAVHTETQQVPVFAMVMVKPGKLGPHLQPHPAGATCPTPPAPGATPPATPQTVEGGYPLTCGGLVGVPASVPGRIGVGARNVTMGLISSSFSGLPEIGRPVLDQTGLTGTYDFTLEFTLQNNNIPAASDNGQTDTGLTFLEALQEQLGLKLVPTKGPVDVFVVDHVEHPSAN